MSRKLGRGETPLRITELLKEEIKKKSQNAISRDSRVAVALINRYLKGIGEPTTATLEKLAMYFKRSVSYLRGYETDEESRFDLASAKLSIKILKDLLELYQIAPKHLKDTIVILVETESREVESILHSGKNNIGKKNLAAAAKLVEEATTLIEGYYQSK
jgi:transcriptional regulator with XRE-family HTH domain